MAIDFTLAPEHEQIRMRVRDFIQGTVIPAVTRPENEEQAHSRREYLTTLAALREEAKALGLWLPHMPPEWGGMGLGHVELAMVQAEAGKTRVGPWVLNCMAPDEGNMHTLLHWGNDEQKERYLRPLCDGAVMSCFAMTEPEVAGSDPTLIRTHAEKDGDEWIINGHKWFISNARRSQFAILIARTEPDVPEGSSGATTAFIVDIPSDGWNDVREVETMHGSTGHSEIVIEDLRVKDEQILGGRGNGHRLGQARLGPARLAHCMRWIAQAETALDMMVDRSITRYSHGSTLAEKQGVQWMIARLGDGAVSVQAHGAAHGLQDRSGRRLSNGGLHDQALRREQSQPDHRPRDPGARRARLFDGHATGLDAPARPVGAPRRWRRRDPPDADRGTHDRGL